MKNKKYLKTKLPTLHLNANINLYREFLNTRIVKSNFILISFKQLNLLIASFCMDQLKITSIKKKYSI